MELRPGIELANLSDVGCERQGNEDYFGYAEPEDDAAFAKKGRLIIVADGMGGYQGGQRASRIAVETIREVFLNSQTVEFPDLLVEGFRAAHAKIREEADSTPGLESMGTTCVAAAVLGATLHFANIGDSRLYFVRGHEIGQLSEDDSVVQKMVAAGVLSHEEAEIHPEKNVLTAALGSRSEKSTGTPSHGSKELLPGDAIVLCTDGLHGQVKDEEMLNALNGQSAKDACKALVDLAKERGGPDNITLQVLRYHGEGLPKTRIEV
jgi:serine/threonine protein phosphatase PrpC